MYFSFQVNRRLWTWKSSFHSASSFLTCFWANFFTCLFTWIRHHQNCIGWVLPKNCNRGWKRLPKFCSWKWIGHEEAFGCLGMYRSLCLGSVTKSSKQNNNAYFFGEAAKVVCWELICSWYFSSNGDLGMIYVESSLSTFGDTLSSAIMEVENGCSWSSRKVYYWRGKHFSLNHP